MPNAGFTSIREPGGFGIRLARVVGEGFAAGPDDLQRRGDPQPDRRPRSVHEIRLRILADAVAHGLPLGL
jgi:hypothetical protein